jgi:hypothetical protein
VFSLSAVASRAKRHWAAAELHEKTARRHAESASYWREQGDIARAPRWKTGTPSLNAKPRSSNATGHACLKLATRSAFRRVAASSHLKAVAGGAAASASESRSIWVRRDSRARATQRAACRPSLRARPSSSWLFARREPANGHGSIDGERRDGEAVKSIENVTQLMERARPNSFAESPIKRTRQRI